MQVVGEIQWPGGGPPPDTPPCGFQGELCPAEDRLVLILFGVALGLLVCLSLASVLIFRHYKSEADIASMTWKIEREEIVYGLGNNRRSSLTRLSVISAASQVLVVRFYVSKFVQQHRGTVCFELRGCEHVSRAAGTPETRCTGSTSRCT